MKILFLDDDVSRVESFQKGTGLVVTHVKNYQEFVDAMNTGQRFDIIMLDHDLGYPEDVVGTGADAMKFLVDDDKWRSVGGVQQVIIHSANPIGVANMMALSKHAPYLQVDVVYFAWAKARYTEKDGLVFGYSI